ncbi:MAG: FAD-dependent oxidoreductase [Rhodobacterales bacterium 17-64-5]|nr:MAG: FAD-dependent oxidoreductase [Rhodobacterales bacterium 17-64-5]
MPLPDQPLSPDPPLEWREGTIPISRAFDDPYFSLAGGLDEARHVFLAGNGLPGRLQDGFHIAELGFGTGLNLMALLLCHRGPGHVAFTSFEAFPLAEGDIARALAAFPETAPFAGSFLAQWAGGQRTLQFPHLTARVIIGDARDTLPAWTGKADAWFLDGFSPAKNPELWSPALMAEVARHTRSGGTFATYSAAGHVRHSLTEAGFTVTRHPGFGRKRHMTTGVLA